jgi:hypothetical protein
MALEKPLRWELQLHNRITHMTFTRTNRVSTTVVALLTVVSLLLSAFPAPFFVAAQEPDPTQNQTQTNGQDQNPPSNIVNLPPEPTPELSLQTVVTPETGTLKVCKIVLDTTGAVSTGNGVEADFSVRVTGPNGYDETVEFSAPLTLTDNLVTDNGAELDAVCVSETVPVGEYRYAEEVIDSTAVWAEPRYHDFFTENPPQALSDFAQYAADGSEGDTDDNDGVANVSKNKARTIAVVNQIERLPLPPVCANGKNLLENGSFEEPTPTKNTAFGGTWEIFKNVAGWVIPEAGLEIWKGLYGGANHGVQNAELDGTESVAISQTIDTIPGATYEIKFDFTPRPGRGTTDNNVEARVNGIPVLTATGDGTGLTENNWQTFSITFVATDDETDITFADIGEPNSFGGAIDNTAVCFVREPIKEEPKLCSVGEGVAISFTAEPKKNNGQPVDANRRTVAALDTVASYSNFFGKDTNSFNPNDFFSLGITGELVYEFIGKIAVDQAGPDIAIWEITGGPTNQVSDEKAEVFVSEDGVTFVSLGIVTGDAALDIAPAGLDYVRFVKLVDKSTGVQGANGDGYDVDAITIIEGSCSQYATVVAHKIVCTDETDLPNYGTGQGVPNITAETAINWVNDPNNSSCRLVPDWQFEWTANQSSDPGDTATGAAGAPWTTFGPTDANGMTSVFVPATQLLTQNKLWFREVLKDGFIPFTHQAQGGKNTDNVSAEFYCHIDVLNYDNREFIDNMKVGETYHCVAWNVPEVEQCSAIVEARIVLEAKGNAGAGQTNEDILLGDGTRVDYGEWFPLTSDTLGTYIADAKNATAFTDPKNTNGLFVSRNGDGTMNVVLYGDHAPGGNTNHEWIIGSVEIRDANIAAATKLAGDFKFENHPEGGDRVPSNDNFDVLNSPTDTSVAFKMWVDTASDGFKVTIDNKSIETCDEDDRDPTTRTIGGVKWHDLNEDGVKDENEPLLNGWTITATNGETSTTTVTDIDGKYRFTLPYGTWTVSETMQSGWIQSAVRLDGELVEGSSCVIDLQAKSPVADPACDFGNYQTKIEVPKQLITACKFDNSEDPVIGWGITISNGTTEGTYELTTGADGCVYQFVNPFLGPWDVTEEDRDGWTFADHDAQGGVALLDDNQVPFCRFFEFVQSESSARTANESSEEDGPAGQILSEFSCDFYNDQDLTDDGIDPDPEDRSNRQSGSRPRQAEARVAGAATQCIILNDFMQIAWDNNPFEVLKLQIFLNAYLGLDMPLNGDFDQTVADAVMRFQEQHHDEIIKPWFERGIVPHDRPTGFVYKTTRWKINDILCPGVEPYPSFDGETLTENVVIR